MQSLPIFIFALLLGIKFLENYRSVLAVPVNYRVSFWMAAILLMQLLVIIYSYTVTDKKEFTSGLTTGPVNTFVFFGNIVLVYILVYLVINSYHAEKLFFKSLMITLIVFLIVVLIPQIIATSSTKLDGWVNFLGRSFEAQHKGRADFYFNGSYTTTLRRVNGFEPEAAYLAALLGIVFVPPILASLKNNFNLITGKVTRHLSSMWLLLAVIMVTLFFAKTSTGFLIIGLIALCLYVDVSKRSRGFLFGLYILMGFGIILLYLVSPHIQMILNQYVLAKKGTDNRLGGTIAAFKTFLTHPLFGVGSGYTSYFYFKYVPHTTIHNWEYQNVFLKFGYPELSIIGNALASYGLLGIGTFIIFIKNKVKAAQKLRHTLKVDTSTQSVFLKTVMDSFYFYLFFFAILSVFTFSWQDEIYLLMLMVYLQIIRRATSHVILSKNEFDTPIGD
jgi:hypothetical protein